MAEIYDYSTPDLGFGRVIYDDPDSTVGYQEYEREFNSTLLFTILTALISGNLMYFGDPGSGKTTTPEIAGQVLFGLSLEDIQRATIYGHPNLTEEKLLAAYDLAAMVKYGRKIPIPTTWALSPFRILDEAPRIPPEITSIVYQMVDRAVLVYDGHKIEAPYGPIYATANFYDPGSYQMTPAFLDRWAVGVLALGLGPQNLERLFYSSHGEITKDFVLSEDDRAGIKMGIHQIGIEGLSLQRLKHLASGLRTCEFAGNYWWNRQKVNFMGKRKAPDFCKDCGLEETEQVCSQINENGMSTRALIAIKQYGQALAWLLGYPKINDQILQNLLRYVNGHRLSASNIALQEEGTEDTRVRSKVFGHDVASFSDNLWQKGGAKFTAHSSVMAKYQELMEDASSPGVSKDQILKDSAALLKELESMEDPAKYDMLAAVHRVRRITRNR